MRIRGNILARYFDLIPAGIILFFRKIAVVGAVIPKIRLPLLPAPVFSAGANAGVFPVMQGESSEIADLGPGVVKRRSVSFAGSIDDCDSREYDLLNSQNSQNRL